MIIKKYKSDKNVLYIDLYDKNGFKITKTGKRIFVKLPFTFPVEWVKKSSKGTEMISVSSENLIKGVLETTFPEEKTDNNKEAE